MFLHQIGRDEKSRPVEAMRTMYPHVHKRILNDKIRADFDKRSSLFLVRSLGTTFAVYFHVFDFFVS